MGMKLRFKLLAFGKYLDEGQNFPSVNYRLIVNVGVLKVLIENFTLHTYDRILQAPCGQQFAIFQVTSISHVLRCRIGSRVLKKYV